MMLKETPSCFIAEVVRQSRTMKFMSIREKTLVRSRSYGQIIQLC